MHPSRTSPSAPAVLQVSDLPGPDVGVRRLSHPGRWVSGVIVLLLLAVLVRAFAMGQIRWDVVGQFLTARVIIVGFGWTLLISACALVLGVVLGFGFGIMRMASNPILRLVAWLYVWIFRGTPVLLQLLIWFNIGLVFPRLYVPGLIDARMVDVITPFVAAVLGLGVNEGSYLTEVVRGGITSVDRGQTEAAHTLGMTPGQTMRRIIRRRPCGSSCRRWATALSACSNFPHWPRRSPWARC